MYNKLFLCRAVPTSKNQIDTFREKGIIAIGWDLLGDLKDSDKNDIRAKLLNNGYSTANTTVGQINHFINNMDTNTLCLVPEPESNYIYLVKVVSDYYYSNDDADKGFKHQRKVEFLNNGIPYDRHDFPDELKKPLSAMLTVANLSTKLSILNEYIKSLENEKFSIEIELKNLAPIAIDNLKKYLNDSNSEEKIEVSIKVLDLLSKYNI